MQLLANSLITGFNQARSQGVKCGQLPPNSESCIKFFEVNQAFDV